MSRRAKRQAKRAERRENRAEKREARGGTRVGAVLKAVKKGAQAVGKGVVTAPLIPFVPMMKSVLRKRGVTVPSKIEDLARAFFQNVARKTEGFEDLEPVTITAIITAIISYFKKLKEKKAKGENLSPEESDVVDEVEKVGEVASELQAEGSVGGVGSNKMLLIGGALLAAFLIFRGK